MITLKKDFRLVAKANKEIVLADEFSSDTQTQTNQPYAFDFVTLDGMLDKISELNLVDNRTPMELEEEIV